MIKTKIGISSFSDGQDAYTEKFTTSRAQINIAYKRKEKKSSSHIFDEYMDDQYVNE